jgi:hypothetical protein
MTQLKTGPITSNALMENLARAKKVMNKVDNGSYERSDATYAPQEDLSAYDFAPDYAGNPNQVVESKSIPNADRINNSKLPDAIKKAMMENPIPQITLNDTLNMDFVKGAKKLMERDSLSNTKKSQQPQVNTKAVGGDLVKQLTPIIESIVTKTIERVLDKKLNELLSAKETLSINENLAIKVGDSIFKGKITGVKSSK